MCGTIRQRRSVILGSKGQATVEAACMIPVACLLVLIMLQPALLLMNHVVMECVANDVCRFMVTQPLESSNQKVHEYALRRLNAVPDISVLHKGEWDVQVYYDEESRELNVAIAHAVKPLPLIGVGLGFIGALDMRGCVSQQVVVKRVLHSDWEYGQGLDPQTWITEREGKSCTS